MYRHCICDGFEPYLERIRKMQVSSKETYLGMKETYLCMKETFEPCLERIRKMQASKSPSVISS